MFYPSRVGRREPAKLSNLSAHGTCPALGELEKAAEYFEQLDEAFGLGLKPCLTWRLRMLKS